MVLFNHATRELTAKIVYYGPGLCGKTTNLLIIFDKLDPKSRGKMLSLATKTDRTLFFDLLPVDIGKVGAFNLRIQLYTVPGQVFYNETRKLVLKGADAVVFVADSQPSMLESNRESFQNLLDNLEQNQIDVNEIPIVIQFNKRDLPGVMPVEDLQDKMGLEGYPYTEAAAIKGEGVMETFKLASKITAKHLISKLQGKPGPALKEPAKPKVAAKREKEKKPAMEPRRREPEPAPAVNPFADSFPGDAAAPFPQAEFAAEPPFPEVEDPSKEYEKVEEVSLESLLESHPITFSGNVPVPAVGDEDLEPLGTEHIVDTGAVAVAVEDEPIPYSPSRMSSTFAEESSGELKALRKELADLKKEHDELISGIRRLTAELTRLISRK